MKTSLKIEIAASSTDELNDIKQFVDLISTGEHESAIMYKMDRLDKLLYQFIYRLALLDDFDTHEKDIFPYLLKFNEDDLRKTTATAIELAESLSRLVTIAEQIPETVENMANRIQNESR